MAMTCTQEDDSGVKRVMYKIFDHKTKPLLFRYSFEKPEDGVTYEIFYEVFDE